MTRYRQAPTRNRWPVAAAVVWMAVACAIPARAAEDATARDKQIKRTRRDVAAHPKSGPYRAQLAFLLYMKFQDEGDRQALDEAIRHAARAVQLAPDHEDVRRIAARCFLATDTAPNLAIARTHAEAALRIDPNDPRTVGLLGLVSIRAGDYAQAKTYYHKREQLTDDFYAYWKWAYFYHELGQGEKAVEAIANAEARDAELTGHRADLSAMKASVLFDLGRYNQARQAITRALALERANISAIRARAYMAKNMGDYDQALEWYLKVPAARRHAIDNENIADVYDATGDTAHAEQYYAKTVSQYEQQVRREEMTGYNNLAYFLASRGRDPQRSLRLARKAVELSPRYHVFDTVAWACYRNGLFAEALKWQQKAAVQPCDQPIWHFHMGMIQWKLGRLPDARRHLRQALCVSPHFHYLHKREARHVLENRLKP